MSACRRPRRPASGPSRLVAVAVATALIGTIPVPSLAQLNPGKLEGEVVDGQGEPVGGIVLSFVSTEGSSSPRNLKVNKKGRFAHSFFPSGRYRVVLDHQDLFLESMVYILYDATGLEIEREEGAAHPRDGLPSLRVPSGYRVALRLAVGTKEEQAKRIQEVAAVEASGPLRKIAGLFNEGDMQAVLAEADRLLQDHPELGKAYYLRGVALWRLSRLDEADRDLRRAIELAPDQEGVLGVLGKVVLERADALAERGDEGGARGLYLQAAGFFEKGLEEDPDDTSSLLNRAAALDRAGATEELVPVLEKIVQVDPGNLDARFRLTTLYTRAGLHDKAMRALEAIPTADKRTAVAIFNVAVSLYNEDRLDESLMAARKAVEIDPDLPEVHRLLARLHLARGDNEAAIPELERFLELAPDDPDADTERRLLEALQTEE